PGIADALLRRMRTQTLSRTISFFSGLTLMACAHPQSKAPDVLNTEKTPVADAKPTVLPATNHPRLIVTLDETLGEKESRKGQTFVATVVPPEKGVAPLLPDGTKIIGRVDDLQAAQSGSAGTITLSLVALKGPDQ